MTHLNFYLDLCVEVFVVEGDAVLLRMHEKYKHWMAPGGHIDPGEDANEAAVREVYEETGITAALVGPADWQQIDIPTNRDLVPPHFVNRHSVTDSHDQSVFVFFGTAKTRDIAPTATQDQQAAAECIWVTQAELDKLHANDERLRADVYRYATAALMRCAQ